MKENRNLKEFQEETVKSVIDRFYNKENSQKRVLVADEVGLGKTMIAKGVLSQVYEREKHKGAFRAVYICSNQNIANQNIEKLSNSENKVCITERLSMLSFRLFKQEQTNMQLIALTPDTSFEMKSRTGTKKERALIYVTLCEIDKFKKYEPQLKEILTGYAKGGFEKSVENIKNEMDDKYIEEIQDKLIEKIDDQLLEKIKQGKNLEKKEWREVVRKLRMIFAKVGIEDLEADLVIMDEFQRFKNLLELKEETDADILIKKFFSMPDLKILLLSATPYKLYATQEEINSKSDEYYKEFLNVMKFLFEKTSSYSEFQKVWDKYSSVLNKINISDFDEVLQKKQLAEDEMYKVISRTERLLSPIKNEQLQLVVNKEDIKSYFQISNIVNKIKSQNKRIILPVDYTKSCPYLLSYMNDYKVKAKIEEYYKYNKNEVDELKEQDLLWLDTEAIDNYQYTNITKTNARLDKVNDTVFKENMEKLLWLPPTKNYYDIEYPFNEVKNVTKTLIFSKWDMVPKMVSTILSYEAERKTIHEAYKETKYFKKDRYPTSRLSFKKDINEKVATMNLLTLLYPSETLSKLFDPIETLNKYTNTKSNNFNEQLKGGVIEKIKELCESVNYDENDNDGASRWYYLFPLLVDDPENVERWFNYFKEQTDRGSVLFKHIEKIEEEYNQYRAGELKLGKKPDSFYEDVMANVVIGSPANCIYRVLKNKELSTRLAQSFIKMFDSPESIATIDLCIKDTKFVYWQKVLQYCFSGNLQAVIEEYFYMLVESNGLKDKDINYKNEKIVDIMEDALGIRTSAFNVDTFGNFKYRVTKNKRNNDDFAIKRMRTHFAVCYAKDGSDIEERESGKKQTNRTETIRNAFNSPFRPFVLTTTSIGQEGLDFHYYCRRIVHWNLPSNPIDLEQRDGRINRYKCLAIRKYIAQNNTIQNFHEDVWDEMFKNVKDNVKDDKGGLIPNWCLPDNHELEIERIVPNYVLSQDGIKCERLNRILLLYRLTLGQPRQENLLNKICAHNENEDWEKLFINLSPYFRNK